MNNSYSLRYKSFKAGDFGPSVLISDSHLSVFGRALQLDFFCRCAMPNVPKNPHPFNARAGGPQLSLLAGVHRFETLDFFEVSGNPNHSKALKAQGYGCSALPGLSPKPFVRTTPLDD